MTFSIEAALGISVSLSTTIRPRSKLPYRGHAGKLFKRDFAGELLERYADLSLVDYGFVYRRDPNFRQDDLTWFLLEKLGQA